MPCIMNAANEIAVDGFLKDKVSFPGIAGIIETCMEQINYKEQPSYDDYIATDMETRTMALELVRKRRVKTAH